MGAMRFSPVMETEKLIFTVEYSSLGNELNTLLLQGEPEEW